MKKKLLLFASFCLCLLCAVSCAGFSETEYAVISEGHVSADGFIYDKFENSTVRITGHESIPALLIIPAEIDGMAVAEIADSAFSGSDILLYAEFPETDIKLGKRIFENCSGLASVRFSSFVNTVPAFMFSKCTNLVAVDCSENLTEIGDQAFADCAFLTSFSAPALISIGDEAFRGCTSLVTFTLPENITYIGSSVFWGCENLVSARVECKADIPPLSFLGCTALTDVSVTGAAVIGDEAFRGCSALYSITFGKELKSIGDSAFYGCDSLAQITFLGNKNEVNISEGNEALEGGAR